MADSREKGKRGEYQVRDLFRKHTKLNWERVPGSGMFGVQHQLKGDIYVPNVNYVHCVEIKNYATDSITSNLLNESSSQLEKFWDQCKREAAQIDKEPILIFKKDRGKWLIATEDFEILDYVPNALSLQSELLDIAIHIVLLEKWLSISRKYIK